MSVQVYSVLGQTEGLFGEIEGLFVMEKHRPIL